MRAADALAWIDEELAELEARTLRRELRGIESATNNLVNLSSNDYLALASDPRVVEAACRAARDSGWGAGAAPLVSGWRREHAALTHDLAEFEGTEAAMLFPSGFAANVGVISALVGQGDAVVLDRLAHASLVAGARLSGATVRVFAHNDYAQLEDLLKKQRSRFRRVLVATEGLFSMDGDLAPLGEIADLCERFDAMLLVDEAHATGVLGPDGRGASSELGVCERVSIRVGTLSKALGSLGGFAVGERRTIDWIMNRAPTFLFSTSLPPAVVAAATAALAIVKSEPERRARVLDLAAELRRGVSIIGNDVGPIVPLVVGAASRAVRESAMLATWGFLVPAIRPPTVPRNSSRLRISVSAAHSAGEIMKLVNALNEVRGGRGSDQ